MTDPGMADPPRPPADVLGEWGLRPVSYLGGTRNQNWLVLAGQRQLVLRGYSSEPLANPSYEVTVVRRLARLGWPVAEVVREPAEFSERLWSLVTHRPGRSRVREDAAERRARGRLLAEFHGTTSLISDVGQREGFGKADQLVNEPELTVLLTAYERACPAEGHLLRWHLDWCRTRLGSPSVSELPALVLHSDFAPWNLLYDEDGVLSGVLDLDGTHLNFRISDFALAWRGDEDEVIEGYDEVSPLSELEWEMLLPTYWAWLFLGVKESLPAILARGSTGTHFEWQTRHFSKRSRLIEQFAPTYAGLA